MSLPEDNKQRALKREWAAARIVVIGGFVAAIAVAGYFAYRERQASFSREQADAAQAVSAANDVKNLERIEAAVCMAELARAKDIGIVPQYSGLASPRFVWGNIPRRYVCEAATHLTQYFIAADLRCNNLADKRCVSIYRVALKDGRLVYSRSK